MYSKPHTFPEDAYLIDTISGGGFPCYEETVFVGQHIVDVTASPDGFTIRFDDFDLKLCPHDNAAAIPSGFRDSHRPARVSVGGHLLNRCSCGGSPEIYIDHVADFFIHCSICCRAVAPNMCFAHAIEEWNSECPCVIPQDSTD